MVAALESNQAGLSSGTHLVTTAIIFSLSETNADSVAEQNEVEGTTKLTRWLASSKSLLHLTSDIDVTSSCDNKLCSEVLQQDSFEAC
jgi:hypothetical protein